MVARRRGAKLVIGGDDEYHARNVGSDVLLLQALNDVAEALHMTLRDYVSVCKVHGGGGRGRLP